MAAAAAAANGGAAAPQSNIENLLDIDFDGAAPASAEQGGTGTPDRMSSPAAVGGLPGAPTGGMADIMGLFDAPAASGSGIGGFGGGAGDMMSSFAAMDLSGNSAPPPPGQQLGHGGASGSGQKSGSEDLLGLF